MANFIDIAVIGDKELQRKLKALDIKMQKKIIHKALRAAAKPILAQSKATAPVLSGRLKKSLKLRARRARRGVFGVQVMTGTRQELGIPAGYPYYYPAAVEYGHARAPAHPFLRPALEANRQKGINIAANVIRQGIEEAARE